MGDYQGISSTHWDEGEYKTETHQNVAAHIISVRDMAGVAGIHAPTMAKKVRISKGKLLATLDYFNKIGKLEFSGERTHIWWKSGIFHSLYKGKYTEKQLQSVQKLLKKWQFSGVFREFWLKTVANLYQDKYGMDLQLVVVQQPKGNGMVSPKHRHSTEAEADTDTETDTETEADTETGIRSAFLKRFDRELLEEDYKTLIEKYQYWELLEFMILNITMSTEFRNPVGMLIMARKAPDQHLTDDKYYKGWKPLLRQVFDRIP